MKPSSRAKPAVLSSATGVKKGIVEMSQRFALRRPIAYSSLVVTVLLFAAIAYSADSQDEWKKTVEAAKKEAKIVAGGPPTAVLRKQYKETFEQKFGIEMELVSAPGPQNAGKAASVTSMFSMEVPGLWNRS